MAVTEDGTNLGGSQTLLGQLADELTSLLTARLQPGGGAAAVRDAAARDTLSRSVHTTHLDGCTGTRKIRELDQGQTFRFTEKRKNQ